MFDLKRISVNLLIAYVVSWTAFFLCLPFGISILGKIIGTAILYALSWVLFIGIIGFAERDMFAYIGHIIGMAKNIVKL